MRELRVGGRVHHLVDARPIETDLLVVRIAEIEEREGVVTAALRLDCELAARAGE